jgi:class 3 adenylate cyclase/tetratricopeptide (TPR) repeat protein
MDFYAVLDQILALLRQRGRVSYRALKRQFDLDDAYLDDLKVELIEVQQCARDQEGTMLVWTGEVASAATPEPVQASAPLTYTPPYLAEKILTSRRALEGERKQVTVLFADLKDSTELIRGLDPEAAQQLLDPALHHMMDAVHRFEGTVNQVLGDGIMALFGAPVAHEDHAMRACYAALAMQTAMRTYTEAVRRTRGLELRMRVGLNSGEVVVRAIGNDLHMDYSAVGETTHLAARMEQLATPGSIRLSAATLRLVEGLVQVSALGPVPVKGLEEPVEVFELEGASALRRRLQAAAARGLTPFVGRQQELEAFHQALARAQAGHGQVVALVGDAGVGKSRLVHECVHSHRTQGWRVLESASVSYGKATPYFPVIDLLKRYCHVDDGDDARTIRAKVTGQVLTLDEMLQDTFPALLALLDALPDDSPFLQLDPPQRRQRTLEALKRVLLRESQVQPLLLVFEDLHWIDSETQALLNSLVESLPTAQLLLLVNYRPEYQHGWGSKTYYTQLRLDPLPPASAEALLQGLLGDDPSLVPLHRLLIARTEGNPFFLEESVRTLVETGVLVGTPSTYRLAQALPTIQVPATVQAVLAARIDRLPPEEKHLLQTAAVIGTEVPFALLQAIGELSEEELRHALGHLQAAEFLYETSLFPELEYTFKHALTHEVAYGSLLQERRRALHAQIVAAIEQLSPDRLTEQVERLAQHALRGEVWDKVLRYCRQAGAKALAHSAHHEAVMGFEQALMALRHLPERRDTLEQAIDLRLDLRTALYSLDAFERILAYLRDAASLAEALGDQRRLGWISTYMTFDLWFTGDHDGFDHRIGHFRPLRIIGTTPNSSALNGLGASTWDRSRWGGRRHDQGHHDNALEAVQRALAIATALEDFDLKVAVWHYMGVIAHALGDYRRAIEVLGWNVAALRGDLLQARCGLPGFPAVLSRAWLARTLVEQGEFATGIAYGEEGLRIAEVVDHPYSRLMACSGVGYLYLCQGALHKASAILEQGLGLCQAMHIPIVFPFFAMSLGSVYALAGRVAEALPLLEQALTQTVTQVWHAAFATHLGEGYMLANRMDEALSQAERALESSRHYRQRGLEAYALHLLGEIAAHREPPDVEPAEHHYRQALALAEELGMRPLVAHCHRGLGTLYAKTGQREQARTALSTAIEMYTSMEMTFWLPQTEAALAQVEGP